MASTYSSSTPFAFSSPEPVATSHKQQPTTHTIKPVTPIGGGATSSVGAAATSTGVSAMPQVASFVAPKVNAGNPNPLDAQYFTDVGKLDSYFQTQTADINAAITQSQVNEGHTERDIAQAMGVLAHNQPLDIQNQQNASNKAGLLHSGYEQKQESNINFQYDTRRTGLNNQLSDAKQALASALAGYQRQLSDVTTNYNLDKQQALLNTIARATAADQAAAGNMQFASSAPAFKTVPYTSPSGARGVLHIYPDGRRVFVKNGGPNGLINRI